MTAPTIADPLGVDTLYYPHGLTGPQTAMMLLGELGCLEAFYGGAGGGGKSQYLLADALRYVDVPGYNALLLRKTFTDLSQPGALIPRSHEWLGGTDAKWSEKHSRWTFPSGATLTFGYLKRALDRYRYQGAEYQFVGFDELTQFSIDEYLYLFTRMRKPSAEEDPDNPLAYVPLRMRSAGNPGGVGHVWVRRRFIEKQPDPDDEQDTPERCRARGFVPARLDDNPHVDKAAYMASLDQADPVVRAQIANGDWYVREPGDWVYDHAGLEEANAAGDDLDALLAAGDMPPPAGELLAIGIDWGEHTHVLIGWPLAGGALYVADEVVGESDEVGEIAARVADRLAVLFKLGRQRRPGASVTKLNPLGDPPPALPFSAKLAPMQLVAEHRYDAAGIQSMRTYMARVRKTAPRAKSKSVAFGAPAPRSGKAQVRKSYKAETIDHLRGRLRQTVASTLDDEGNPIIDDNGRSVYSGNYLAISARCPELRRQLPLLEWLDREAGTIKKGDDHGPDALIALDAPIAVRQRRRG